MSWHFKMHTAHPSSNCGRRKGEYIKEGDVRNKRQARHPPLDSRLNTVNRTSEARSSRVKSRSVPSLLKVTALICGEKNFRQELKR